MDTPYFIGTAPVLSRARRAVNRFAGMSQGNRVKKGVT